MSRVEQLSIIIFMQNAEGQPGDMNWKSSPEEEVINLVSFSSLVSLFCGCEAPGSQRCFVQQLGSIGNEHVIDMQNYTLVTIDLLKCFRGKCPHKYGNIVMECVLIDLNLALSGLLLPPLVSPSCVNAVLQTWLRCHLSVCPCLSCVSPLQCPCLKLWVLVFSLVFSVPLHPVLIGLILASCPLSTPIATVE